MKLEDNDTLELSIRQCITGPPTLSDKVIDYIMFVKL